MGSTLVLSKSKVEKSKMLYFIWKDVIIIEISIFVFSRCPVSNWRDATLRLPNRPLCKSWWSCRLHKWSTGFRIGRTSLRKLQLRNQVIQVEQELGNAGSCNRSSNPRSALCRCQLLRLELRRRWLPNSWWWHYGRSNSAKSKIKS